MEISCAVRQLASSMHQELMEFAKTEEDIVEYMTKYTKKDEALECISFIDEMFSSGMSATEMNDLWGRAGSDWHLHKDGPLVFFRALRKKLTERLGKA